MHRIARTLKLMHPPSQEEQQLIRDELARLLKSRHFSNSRPYPALLSYIVAKTLAGHTEELKDRVLGVEVFHRRSNCSTAKPARRVRHCLDSPSNRNQGSASHRLKTPPQAPHAGGRRI